ncbi:MAG: VOC family protein [Sphingomicrobium sp.]
MTGAFIWYELVTPDVDSAKIFYDAVVGWNVASTSDFPNGYRMIGRSDGKAAGGVLPLTDEMRVHGARPIWLAYLHVDDIDSTAAAIAQDGGKIVMAPFDIPHVGRVALVSDPVGVPFYIMTPTPPADQPEAQSDVFSVDQAQHIRWNELGTRDRLGAIAFFQKHFGWTQQGEMEMGPLGTYSFVRHDGVGIGAIMDKMPEAPASAWTFYIGVDDIDCAAAAITECGGSVIAGPMEIPGGEFSVVAIDPHGATFGIVGPRKK